MRFNYIHWIGLKNVIFKEDILLNFPKTLGEICWMIMEHPMMIHNICEN
eukprot:UN11774